MLALALSFICLSCADVKKSEPVAAKKSANVKGLSSTSSLNLSWDAQSGVSVFHVFYKNPLNKIVEIDSITNPSAQRPSLVIDHNNMESWPAKGQKACFYVVAEASGILSDSSDYACITL